MLTFVLQGYNVGEEYKTISFDTFKDQYAANGMPESVSHELLLSLLTKV